MYKASNNEKILKTSSQYVKGVGPARQRILARMGIENLEDLLMHFPRTYYDRSDTAPISGLEPGKEATFEAVVLASSLRRIRRGSTILTVAVGDETGRIDLVFFNQPYLKDKFKQGDSVMVSGTVGLYRGEKQINSPDCELLPETQDVELIHTGRIVPVYPLTAGITQRMMRRIISAGLEKCRGAVDENLPGPVMRKMGFMRREEAFRLIHYPGSFDERNAAAERFKFEEAFFIHLFLKRRRKCFLEGRERPLIKPPYRLMKAFLESLPFELTGAQRKVLNEIKADIESKEGLARLLQGDVGSGKTVVGLASMLAAVDNGYQAAMMVPTEILAEQHFDRTRDYLNGMDLKIELLVGSIGRSEKKRIRRELEDGEVDIVLGTQALIQEGITFHRLGLAVIDEQHRFGVKQRARLGKSDYLPHFLVMTATPIPRSMAQIVYGDLRLSVIDELPTEARKVRTEIIPENAREECYRAAREVFSNGGQAFILYPVIEENEGSDLMSATAEFERLQRDVFPDVPLGLLHGRMSHEEKSKAIKMFRKGEIPALVTTTVIEVGVDVPGAEMIIINNPERFGLAQLHQLRGRIGRTGQEGLCCLIQSEQAGAISRKRLAYFAGTDDGFQLAEMDLEIRGPGEIWGTRQSGRPVFRLLNPIRDNEIVRSSWRESDIIIEEDPSLEKSENRVVADYFHYYYKPGMEIAEIG